MLSVGGAVNLWAAAGAYHATLGQPEQANTLRAYCRAASPARRRTRRARRRSPRQAAHLPSARARHGGAPAGEPVDETAVTRAASGSTTHEE